MKKPTTRSLINKLDRIFSEWIRRSDADRKGEVSCFTCGRRMHWKACHAGHYVSRRHMAGRWVEKNVNIQCVYCNTYLHGALDEYSNNLVERYGLGVLVELLELKRKTVKFTRGDLEGMIETYKQKVASL